MAKADRKYCYGIAAQKVESAHGLVLSERGIMPAGDAAPILFDDVEEAFAAGEAARDGDHGTGEVFDAETWKRVK